MQVIDCSRHLMLVLVEEKDWKKMEKMLGIIFAFH